MYKKTTLLIAFLFSLALNAVQAQTKTAAGTVRDENGKPMQGASVQASGSSAATVTNGEGRFSFSVPSSVKELTITFAGYASQTVAYANEISVVLRTSAANLDEVVITGYTTTKRVRSAVASSVVSAKEIQDVPMTNVNDILQGRAAGLTVSSTTGQPGGVSNIRVRGVGSISAGTQPLYVIDGIIIQTGQVINGQAFTQSNDILANLNPNDIENVTVLKDAASLALYGSRGGNGVVVITTKKGKSGASKVNFSAQYGRTKASFGEWGMMDARQVYDYERKIYAVNGFTQAQIDTDYPGSMLDKTFNWVDAAFVNGNVQSYDLSFSGGNDKVKHFASLGYYEQEGNVLNSGFKRVTANLSIDDQISKRLKVGLTFNTSFSNTKNADGGSFFSSPISATLTNSPLHLYPYQADGSLYRGYEPYFATNSVNGDNFLYSANLNYNTAKQFRGIGKVYADLKLANWLTFKQNVALDLIYAREKNFFDPTTGNGINFADPSKSGQVIEGLTNPFTFTSQSSLSGNILSGGKHELDYLALMEYQKFSSTSIFSDGIGIVDGSGLQVLNVTSTPNATYGGATESAFLSYLGQLNYTFNGKYSLNTSARRDGSSRFGANNRYATFYSVGGAWRLNMESFIANLNVFNDLRLRASYGTTGVAEFGDFAAKQLYSYTTTYNGAPGSNPIATSPGNPDLTWEKNKQFDLGLDFTLLKNRIRGTVDYYQRRSVDLLQNVPVSRTSGYSTAQRNVGQLENKGVEVSLGTTNLSIASFTWTSDITFAYNTNRVLKLNNGQDIAHSGIIRSREGYPLQSWFLPVWAGVDPANGDPLWYLADGKTTTNSYATASRTENRKLVGSALPKYTFGFGNTFNYKGVSLNLFFYGISGSKVYDQTMSFIDSDGLRFGWNYYKDADKNFWTTPGQAAERPKPVIGGNQSSASASTRWLESNDYIRLRTATLSYVLPKNWMSRAKLSNARLYVTGTNLLTFTNYKGVDPEAALTGSDFFKYPVNKSVVFGLDVNF